MALNREFRVKDDFNALKRILSGGRDLVDIFSSYDANFLVSAYNVTFNVSGSEAFNFQGANGIVVEGNGDTQTLVFSAINATDSQRGVASFSSTNFVVTNGDVALAVGGVQNSNLDQYAVDREVIDPNAIVKADNALRFNQIDGFSVEVDNTSIEISSSALSVKDVDFSKVSGTVVYSSGAISRNLTQGLSANVDNSTIEISSNNLQVKDHGITNTKLLCAGIVVNGDTGTGTTNLGDTLTVAGTQYQIDTVASAGTVTISLPSVVNLPGDLIVDTGETRTNNLSVYGNLFVSGSAEFRNTLFSTTTSLSVVNTGTGPALYVSQAGSSDIASFYDVDGLEVLHVGNVQPSGLGRIGINTSTPNVDGLTVNGYISASDIIYFYDKAADVSYNSLQWSNTYSSVNAHSANWDSTYSSVYSNSASWGDGGSANAYLNSLTGKWESNWSYVNTSSSTFLTAGQDIVVSSVTVSAHPTYSVKDIFRGSITSNNQVNVTTFDKVTYDTIKYIASCRRDNGLDPLLRTSMEILATKSSGGVWDGTVYAILDQDSILNDVQVDTTGANVNLRFYFNGVDDYIVSVIGEAIVEG